MEVAWLAMNRHPYHQDRRGGRIWVVCASEDHLADTICPKLFRQNDKFRMIRDPVTNLWRSFRPYEPWDVEHQELSKPMPPMIGSRYFAAPPSYITKSRGSIKQVRLKTGWEITFFLGGSTPPAGADVDYVWFDEEIGLLMWYTEMAARLLDRRGWLTWTCTPQVGGEALQNFHLLCDKHAGYPPEERTAQEFHLLLSNNAFVGTREKAELAEQYENDPDTYRVRILGEYLTQQHLVYPTFSKAQHCCDGFAIPAHWCRYAVVDPGHQVCATLFLAVPPDGGVDGLSEEQLAFDKQCRGHVYVYDELVIRQCDAAKWAKEFRERVGSLTFETFLIDWHGSRRTEMGGETIRQQFAAALRQNDIQAMSSRHDFYVVGGDVKPGLNAVRRWLNEFPLNGDGKPVLQLFGAACPNTLSEIQRYHTKKVNNVWTDEPHQVNNHCMDCLRYAAVHGVPYVRPRPLKRLSRAYLRMQDKRKRNSREPTGMVLGAIGSG